MKFFFSIVAICGMLLLFPSFGLGQGEAFHWYFGGYGPSAGLSFHTDPPTALNDGEMAMVSGGGATISDPCGNLLFYTDADTVWNRNHQPMPNGFGLWPWPSMHAVIAPHPGNSDQYFLFTTGDNLSDPLNPTYDLNYSIIDLSLDGGMGDVIMKNTFLTDSTSHKNCRRSA